MRYFYQGQRWAAKGSKKVSHKNTKLCIPKHMRQTQNIQESGEETRNDDGMSKNKKIVIVKLVLGYFKTEG